MKRLIYFLLFLPLVINAQKKDSTEFKPRAIISFNFTQLFLNKVQFEYEILGFKKNLSPVIALTLGSRSWDKNTSYYYEEKQRINKTTRGIQLSNKFFVNSINTFDSFKEWYYFNLGVQYQNIKFDYTEGEWQNTSQNGFITYNFNDDVSKKAFSNRLGMIAHFGVMFKKDNMILDLYLGANLLKDHVAGINNDIVLPLILDSDKSRYGATVLPNAGIKLGLQL